MTTTVGGSREYARDDRRCRSDMMDHMTNEELDQLEALASRLRNAAEHAVLTPSDQQSTGRGILRVIDEVKKRRELLDDPVAYAVATEYRRATSRHDAILSAHRRRRVNRAAWAAIYNRLWLAKHDAGRVGVDPPVPGIDDRMAVASSIAWAK